MTNKTATLVKANLPGFNGRANLYRMNPPLEARSFGDDEEGTTPTAFEYVVVSAASVMYSGPETYIFGADKDGEIVDWAELPGSFRGSLNHNEALERAGYDVVVVLA